MIPKRVLSNADYQISNSKSTLTADALKIKTIDALPHNLTIKITQINISNNYLSGLGEIRQFVNLQ